MSITQCHYVNITSFVLQISVSVSGLKQVVSMCSTCLIHIFVFFKNTLFEHSELYIYYGIHTQEAIVDQMTICTQSEHMEETVFIPWLRFCRVGKLGQAQE